MKNFIEIHEHEKFGKLIQLWSEKRGQRPRTIAELEDALRNYKDEAGHVVGIGYTLPSNGSKFALSEILYCDLRDKHLTLIIPTPKQIKQGLKEAADGKGQYPLPSEYALAFEGGQIDVDDEDHRKKILYARIGDYCIGSCM